MTQSFKIRAWLSSSDICDGPTFDDTQHTHAAHAKPTARTLAQVSHAASFALLCPGVQQSRRPSPRPCPCSLEHHWCAQGGIFLIGKRHPLSSSPPAPVAVAPYRPGSNSAHPPAGAVSTDILPSRHRPSDTRARVHFAYNSYILHIATGLHHRKSPRQLTDEDRFVWIRGPVSPEGFQNKGSLKVPRCCVQESTDGKRRHLYLPFLFLPPACLNRQSLLNLRLLILSIPSSLLPCPFWSWLRTKQPSYSHLIAWRNDSSPSLPIGEARQHDQEPTAKSDFHLGQPHSVPFVLFVF